jgi:hypothetical protein
MRKMNNDITAKFKSVNAQMKKDNVDFLRSITRTYGDTLQSTGETAVNVPETAGKAAGAAAGGAAAAAGGSSVLDTVMGIGSTVADFFSGSKKAVGAAAAKETVKDVAKGAAKPTLKAVVKKTLAGAIGKQIAKAIPGVALVAGLFSSASRALEGDFTGAASEAATGLAATLPGVGTAAAVAGNVALLARDIYKEYYGEFPEKDPKAGDRLKEIVDMIKGEISGDVKDDVKETSEMVRVGGEEVKQGEPLSDKQMMAMESAISMGNKYPDWLMEQYKKQKSEGTKRPDTALPNFNPADVGKLSTAPTEGDILSQMTPQERLSTAPTEGDILSQMTPQERQPASASDAEKGTPIKVADIPASTPPADVPAEGNTPASVQAGTPAQTAPPAAAIAIIVSPRFILLFKLLLTY